MNETGDQMAMALNALTISDKSVVFEIMDEMKDKCELMVNTKGSDDKTTDGRTEDEDEIKVSIVGTDVKPSTDGHKDMALKSRTEKWGESVGIFDDKDSVKRVVSLDQLHNYLTLTSSGFKTNSHIYCSLINERFPRFFDSTVDYLQRWRMRYNIFADNVLADKSDPSVVHIGELHLYFDLLPRFPNPHYMNSSFYLNSMPSERPIDEQRLKYVLKTLDSIRQTRDVLQLKFPIKGYLFTNTNHVFEKFIERQQEMLEESLSVHRKGFNKKRILGQSGLRGQQRGMTYDRNYGQSSHDFHQTGQQFARNDRNFGRNTQSMSSNVRDFGSTERQDFGRSDRSERMRGRGLGRMRGTDRRMRSSNFVNRHNKNDNNMDSDVMFEDTGDRYEKKSFPKSNRGLSRSDQTVDNFSAHKRNYRPNGRQLNGRRNADTFDVNERHQFPPSFGRTYDSLSSQVMGHNRPYIPNFPYN